MIYNNEERQLKVLEWFEIKLKQTAVHKRALLVKTSVFLLCTLVLWRGYLALGFVSPAQGTDLPAVKAKVIGIQSRDTTAYDLGGETVDETVISYFARILSGERKGSMVFSKQALDPFYPTAHREIAVGDKVLLHPFTGDTGQTEWQTGEYVRTDGLLWLGAGYVCLVFLLGRKKGFWVILSLALTVACIFLLFVPAVLTGRNAYTWSVVTCLFIIFSTFILISGASRKTAAAAAGCTAGIFMSGVLTLVMTRLLELSGFIDENSTYLAAMDGQIDLKAVMFAGILIGALGVAMDVSMSIASALWEIRSAGCVSPSGLWKSGLAIGQDIMGTMANTLVLAYIGNSLSIVLLLTAYSTSILVLLNRELIVVEVLFALVGSIGILFVIPLTSAVCVLFYGHSLILSDGEGP